MKRTVNILGKLNWGTRACAVLVLCATTAIALPAQTLTTLYTFCSQSGCTDGELPVAGLVRSEEHTSELQSLRHLVCRLLLEKIHYTTIFRSDWKNAAGHARPCATRLSA